MAVRFPQELTSTQEPPEQITARPLVCSVEECDDVAQTRFFPHYKLDLCTAHWIRAADEHRKRGVFW